jgi:hypothetical protein
MTEHLPPEANVSTIPARPQAPGTVGAPRVRHGRLADRWGRSEEQVRAQHELADAIARRIAECRRRAPEIEPGNTLSPKMLRRLEIAARGFERLANRDEAILGEFDAYHGRGAPPRPAEQNGAAA